jgi:hypothetical protein
VGDDKKCVQTAEALGMGRGKLSIRRFRIYKNTGNLSSQKIIFYDNNVFNSTILAFNLPRATRIIMTFAMVGIVTSILISMSLLPPPPDKTPRRKRLYMVLQWLLMPVILIVFGAIPALDAQTRLMLGKYMGFWVTPKYRSQTEALKGDVKTIISPPRKEMTQERRKPKDC